MKFKVGDKVKVKSSGVEHWIKGIHGENNPSYELLDEPGWFEEDDIEPVEKYKTDAEIMQELIEERNNKPTIQDRLPEELEKLLADDPIEPQHYRKGEMDLFEAWSKIYPPNEYRAGMQMIAMRYMFRDKDDRVQDLNKAIETLERLKEYEEHEK